MLDFAANNLLKIVSSFTHADYCNSATDFNGYCSRTNSHAFARVWSASIVGIDALKVGVEIDVSGCREL